MVALSRHSSRGDHPSFSSDTGISIVLSVFPQLVHIRIRITHSGVYQPTSCVPSLINDGLEPGAESAVRVVITFVLPPQSKHFMPEYREVAVG